VSIRPCPMCGSTHPFFVAVWPPLWTSVCSVYLKLLPPKPWAFIHQWATELGDTHWRKPTGTTSPWCCLGDGLG
jgi:hypothetical protein